MIVTKTTDVPNPKPKLKLKIKFPSQGQRIEAIPTPQSFHSGQCLSTSLDETKMSSDAFKRRPEGEIVGGAPMQKKLKMMMDRTMTKQCSALLNALTKHPAAGMVFNPKAVNNSDYFTKLENPMDFPTIKSKLASNTYLGIQEFAADVKLTFSNVMHYYHKMSEEISEFFEERFKCLEENWNHQKNLEVGDGKILSTGLKDVRGSRKGCSKTWVYGNSFWPKKSKVSESEDRNVTVALNARTTEVELSKAAQKCVSKLARKTMRKGTSSGGGGSGGRSHGSINARTPLSHGACKCSSCGSIKCQCSLPSESNLASSKVKTAVRSLGRDLRACGAADASKLDCQEKSKMTSQMSKSNPNSKGAASGLDEENVCLSSEFTTLATDVASGQGLLPAPIIDSQMSPKKALRAAMLKSRFADTILKAQQEKILVHVDNADPVKMQQEKEKLERRKREEEARREAQIRAAEAAARMKEEVELKNQREREREASRIALQKMENTAGIELNLEILKEFEMLIGCSLSGGNPLHQLGLFMKDEYLEDEEDKAILNEDVEEGEILP